MLCLLCVVGSFPRLALTCLLPISAGEDGDKKGPFPLFSSGLFCSLSLSLYTHYNGVWEEEEQMRANDSFGLAKKRRRRPPISSYPDLAAARNMWERTRKTEGHKKGPFWLQIHLHLGFKMPPPPIFYLLYYY